MITLLKICKAMELLSKHSEINLTLKRKSDTETEIFINNLYISILIRTSTLVAWGSEYDKITINCHRFIDTVQGDNLNKQLKIDVFDDNANINGIDTFASKGGVKYERVTDKFLHYPEQAEYDSACFNIALLSTAVKIVNGFHDNVNISFKSYCNALLFERNYYGDGEGMCVLLMPRNQK